MIWGELGEHKDGARIGGGGIWGELEEHKDRAGT